MKRIVLRKFSEELLSRAKFHRKRTIGCWVMMDKNNVQYDDLSQFWILKKFTFSVCLSSSSKSAAKCYRNRVIFRWDVAIYDFEFWRFTTLNLENLQFMLLTSPSYSASPRKISHTFENRLLWQLWSRKNDFQYGGRLGFVDVNFVAK